MDHPQLSPASLCDSELDDTSSSANSPMSISSAEACSSPYDSSRLSEDEDLTLADQSSYSNSPISSPPPSPSPSESICNNNNSSSSSYGHSNQHIWSDNNINPYYSGAKSIRWFRDDRGLWSERTSSVNSRVRSSPYQRNTQSKTHATSSSSSSSNKHKQISEVLIEAVCRQDQTLLHNLLAAGKGSAHVNILGQEGDSPLHRSCRMGDLETVKLLVRYGANTELTNREGWSPLHLAVHGGYQEIVVYLLSMAR